MRVALFGGSFNPPHVAHQLVALYVLETQAVDQVWFVPCFEHPFNKPLQDFEDRLEMCRITAEALGPRARVSDIEKNLGGQSRTVRTVRALHNAHPEHQFLLIIGADLQTETNSWYGADELRRLVAFIVVGRQGHPGGTPVTMPAVSSTEVRQRLAGGAPVDEMLSRRVLDYIRQRKLYR